MHRTGEPRDTGSLLGVQVGPVAGRAAVAGRDDYFQLQSSVHLANDQHVQEVVQECLRPMLTARNLNVESDHYTHKQA